MLWDPCNVPFWQETMCISVRDNFQFDVVRFSWIIFKSVDGVRIINVFHFFFDHTQEYATEFHTLGWRPKIL